MQGRAVPLVVAAAVVLATCGAPGCRTKHQATIAEGRWQTSSVSAANCTELGAAETGQVPELRLGSAVLRCRAPAGHIVYVVDDGTRSWVVLERRSTLHSLEEEIVYEGATGNFSNIGSGADFTWLLVDEQPAGVVFPVDYQSATAGKSGFDRVTRYLAYALGRDGPVLVTRQGRIEEAQRELLSALGVSTARPD